MIFLNGQARKYAFARSGSSPKDFANSRSDLCPPHSQDRGKQGVRCRFIAETLTRELSYQHSGRHVPF